MSSNISRSLLIFICFSLLIVSKGLSVNMPMDSLGIQKDGNKTFILHQVDPKETLFSLSKRYNVKVAQIEAENPDLKDGLKIGQVLKIPYSPKSPVTAQNTSKVKTHIVGQGQTLYSISRMYKVSVDNLKKWNNLSSNEVNVGQEINVSGPSTVKFPTANTTISDAQQVKEQPKHVPNFKYDSKGNKVHVTENGQTLYSIAQIYNIPVEDIKKMNALTQDEISTGQEIIVEKAREKESAQAPAVVEAEKLKEVPNTQMNPIVSPAKVDSQRQKSTVVKVQPTSNNANSDFSKVTERGLAEAIEESGENPKFLALHKTATVGTIIQVKNELNNLYIFARVIGKLPENGTNDKLVVKLSKRAYDKLGAVDKRFPVEVSYVPQ